MNIFTIKYSFGEERLRQGTARALPPGEAFARALTGRRGRYQLVVRDSSHLLPLRDSTFWRRRSKKPSR